MALFNRGGLNPLFGRDAGPPPPGLGRASVVSSYPGQTIITLPQMPIQYIQPQGHGVQAAVAGTAVGEPAYHYASGLGGSGRLGQARPVINPAMPAANMTNNTGGVGCEPGYNYFFPA